MHMASIHVCFFTRLKIPLPLWEALSSRQVINDVWLLAAIKHGPPHVCRAHFGVNCTFAGVGTGERRCVNSSFTRQKSEDGSG